MNDAEIMELVDEVRRCERAVQQAKNALEVAKRDAAVAACPYKEGDIVSGWDRDGTSPAKVDKILFTPGCNTIRRRRMTPNERRLTLMWVAFFL